ncbi:MAG: hypothetical protein QOJ48_1451 [Frankiales bacterium]|jgi:hypothetical protein|nr:hypothetical protein [Frankiales bacterium]
MRRAIRGAALRREQRLDRESLAPGDERVYRPAVVTMEVPLDDIQRAVAVDVAVALESEDWTALRMQLVAAERNKVWLSPPLLGVAAALIQAITASAPERPWSFTNDLWDQYLPDAKPFGGTQWRKASFATQAAGCLAGGVWLDVGATESYWQSPFWLDIIDVVDLLRRVAADLAGASWGQLADRVLQSLALKRPAATLD